MSSLEKEASNGKPTGEKYSIEVQLSKDALESVKRYASANHVSVSEYISTTIQQAQAQNVDTKTSERWFWELSTSADKRALFGKVGEFGCLFDDMLFKSGSITHDCIACEDLHGDGIWRNGTISIPESLEYFSYEWFDFSTVKLPEGTIGRFDPVRQVVEIDPEYKDNDAVLLHEMIHLHEFVLNSLPLYFHDVFLWRIYRDLCEKVSDLDKWLLKYGHIDNERTIMESGGLHDVLFLLKSLDLDLRMGYSLGTVFGYGITSPVQDTKRGSTE